MSRLSELYNIYSNVVNFRFVYILEAHAQDEWPISSARWSRTNQPIMYNQTRTIEQRLSVAKDFIRDFDFPIPVVLDKPDENLFEKFYAPWPVRIYIIDNEHRLTYKAQPSETMLELNELTAYLESMMK